MEYTANIKYLNKDSVKNMNGKETRFFDHPFLMTNCLFLSNIGAQDGEELKRASLLIEDGKIKDILDISEITGSKELSYMNCINMEDHLVLPGFFNIHAHSPMSILRGYGEGLSLHDWLTTRIFPFEAELDEEAVYFATLLSIAESLRYGIVSTTDMYFFTDSIAKAYTDADAKVNLSRAIASTADGSITELASFKEAVSLYEQHHKANNGKVLVDMSVHAEYTSNENVVRQVCEYCRSLNLNMHIHASETKREHEECKEKYKKTPVQYFDSLGAFESPTTLAHGVWLEDSDMLLMAGKNVSLAHCPISNMKLASGTAQIKKAMNYGVNIGIGTDGTASNNSLAFIEEMKTMGLLAKLVDLDPTGLPLDFIYRAGTINGAIAQGRGDCGEIKIGNKADLIAIDLRDIGLSPSRNISTNIIYSLPSDSIKMTMVDGNVLYSNGDYHTIDIEHVMKEANKAVARILGKLNS
jgi:5-methylthioadenosine/S-adenosylhomocysteine deaminase